MDRFVNDEGIPAKHAYVGLAPPGDAGSWQRECKVFFFLSGYPYPIGLYIIRYM